MRETRPGDVVLLYGEKDGKYFIRMLKPGGRIQTHNGELSFDNIIGQPYGKRIRTHLNAPYLVLSPTTDELVRNIRRISQIIYPKDAGYMLLKLGIKPGFRVLESGTGSGGMTLTLATMVGDEGHVYSYDVREDMQDTAHENLKNVGLDHRVTFRNSSAADGFEDSDMDAVILDLPRPWIALDAAHRALRGGGMLGCLVPTVNQLASVIGELEQRPDFGFVEAEELILRPYKTVPARVRPEDRIIAHTGFLIFARALLIEE